ncbi:MAG: APC family permease [Lachnospiraceae bacterium]|nr:APC family permease [Lachnospiraceae bacterium]
MQEKKYGLLTAITMITGIVIGSGIFFKSDDVLRYTNGNMFLGIIVFAVAAIAIVFGSLTIAQLASRTDAPGGIVGYMESFVNRKVAGAAGWFQMFLYFAPIIGVVAWVTGLYMCQLFQIESTIKNSSLIAAIMLALVFGANALSAALGGFIQNAAMIIKLIPLIIFAIAGILFGKPMEIAQNDFSTLSQTVSSSHWVAAFAPIAFSYDGWSVATTICHEIKNSKKNLPLAMIIAPITVLACYLLYFVGITSLVGVETVLKQGNDSVYTAASQIFGGIGAKLILIFVIISVLGTLNGLVLAFIQLPYSLAIRNMVPCSKLLTKQSKHFGHMPVYSALLAFGLCLFWLIINYFTQENGMVGDVSEVPVCLSYLLFSVLYIMVMKLRKQGEIKSNMMGYVVPSLAILGSVTIVGGTITHPSFMFFVIISVIVSTTGYWYSARN